MAYRWMDIMMINSSYPDMGEWTEGGVYTARGHRLQVHSMVSDSIALSPLTHITIRTCLIYFYDV